MILFFGGRLTSDVGVKELSLSCTNSLVYYLIPVLVLYVSPPGVRTAPKSMSVEGSYGTPITPCYPASGAPLSSLQMQELVSPPLLSIRLLYLPLPS
jgi:hypothetical protein